MLNSKLTVFLVLMTCLHNLSNVVAYGKQDSAINCSIARKCSNIEDIVWATDYENCYLFRNPCIFANEMCMRRAKYEYEYKNVTKEVCKKYCRNTCFELYDPVCGEYDNEFETFSNKCFFYSFSCSNDKSYIFQNDGECFPTIEA